MSRESSSEGVTRFEPHEQVGGDLAFAQGFAWAIPQAFRPGLGIYWLPKVVGGVQRYEWVQTPNYAFAANDMLYRTPLAYLSPWEKAVQHIDWGLQIEHALPASRGDAGAVSGVLYDFRSGRAVHTANWTCTQRELVEALRTDRGAIFNARGD